jgi:hypothetical protein
MSFMLRRLRVRTALGVIALTGVKCVLAAGPPDFAAAAAKARRGTWAVLHEQRAVCLGLQQAR